MEHYLTGSRDPFPFHTFPTIEKVVETVLRQLSIRNLSSTAEHVKLGPGAVKRPVEAAYKDEFYRVLNVLLGFSSTVSSEWSGGGNGQIDLWIPGSKWGIELLREGDRLDEHCKRFVGEGSYTKWIQDGWLQDWLIIDCRTTSSRPYSKFTPCSA
jgi:hypothetical protein